MVGAAFRRPAHAFLWIGSAHQNTDGTVRPSRIQGTSDFISGESSWK